MAIITARQGQHDLIQFLKKPKERHLIDNPPDDKIGQELPNAKDAQESGPATEDM